ncbi:hypothetical protein C8F01DRAFT_1175077 [Mycena amicta]|nr:hypothetical protein C8F01DRAFT_1175077 [Mycena amicta]
MVQKLNKIIIDILHQDTGLNPSRRCSGSVQTSSRVDCTGFEGTCNLQHLRHRFRVRPARSQPAEPVLVLHVFGLSFLVLQPIHAVHHGDFRYSHFRFHPLVERLQLVLSVTLLVRWLHRGLPVLGLPSESVSLVLERIHAGEHRSFGRPEAAMRLDLEPLGHWH